MKSNLIFICVILAAVGVLSSAGKKTSKTNKKDDKKGSVDKEDAQITGPYGLTTDPDNSNMTKLLEAQGFTEDQMREVRNNKKILVVIHRLNQTHFSKYDVVKKRRCVPSNQPGREYEKELECPLEKRTHTVIRKKEFESKYDMTFGKGGFKITMRVLDMVAILQYKKLQLNTKMKGKVDKWLNAMISEYFGEDQEKWNDA